MALFLTFVLILVLALISKKYSSGSFNKGLIIFVFLFLISYVVIGYFNGVSIQTSIYEMFKPDPNKEVVTP